MTDHEAHLNKVLGPFSPYDPSHVPTPSELVEQAEMDAVTAAYLAKANRAPKHSEWKRHMEALRWGVVVSVLLYLLLGAYCAPKIGGYFFGATSSWYETVYSLSADHVFVEPTPHGCAYDDAPLGSKHCAFERHVELIRPSDDQPITDVFVSYRRVED